MGRSLIYYVCSCGVQVYVSVKTGKLEVEITVKINFQFISFGKWNRKAVRGSHCCSCRNTSPGWLCCIFTRKPFNHSYFSSQQWFFVIGNISRSMCYFVLSMICLLTYLSLKRKMRVVRESSEANILLSRVSQSVSFRLSTPSLPREDVHQYSGHLHLCLPPEPGHHVPLQHGHRHCLGTGQWAVPAGFTGHSESDWWRRRGK